MRVLYLPVPPSLGVSSAVCDYVYIYAGKKFRVWIAWPWFVHSHFLFSFCLGLLVGLFFPKLLRQRVRSHFPRSRPFGVSHLARQSGPWVIRWRWSLLFETQNALVLLRTPVLRSFALLFLGLRCLQGLAQTISSSPGTAGPPSAFQTWTVSCALVSERLAVGIFCPTY